MIRSVVEKTMLPNFTYSDQVLLTEHQVIDGIGAMFLQSIHGRLILFPNWTMQTDAAFHQLREDSAFLVSSAVKGGVIGSVTIKSEKGIPCRVQNPWPGRGVKMEADGPPLLRRGTPTTATPSPPPPGRRIDSSPTARRRWTIAPSRRCVRTTRPQSRSSARTSPTTSLPAETIG